MLKIQKVLEIYTLTQKIQYLYFLKYIMFIKLFINKSKK